MQRDSLGRASPKGRRSRGGVTQNACTECRRRRAKCDGQNPCSGCTGRSVIECIYELPTRISKEHMRKEVKELQLRLRARDTVFDALVMHESSDLALCQLRDKVSPEEIADHVCMLFPILGNRQPPSDYGSYESLASGSGKSYHTYERNVNQSWRGASHSILAQESQEEEQFKQTTEGIVTEWTEVSSNKAMIENMFALYFTWEHPIFQTLSKEHFLLDFRAGTERYCSSLLVNAMLALGWQLSLQQVGQSGPEDDSMIPSRFFAESKRILAMKNTPMLTVVQALGLMSLYEASCSNDSESWFFSCQSIQAAIEIGLHIEMPILDQLTAVEQEVHTVTFWGAFCLNQAWSLALGRLPITSRDVSRVAKYPVAETNESSSWAPYSCEGTVGERSSDEYSQIRSTNGCFCQLAEIITGSVYALYTPGGNISSIILLDIYASHVAWKDSLPDQYQIGATPIPAVLFLHIYYHFALIMLFRPFINFRFLGSAVIPLEVCAQAANKICSLIQIYRHIYSLHQVPVFTPYILLASAIVHLVTLRPSPIQFGGSLSLLPEIEELQLLSLRAPFCGRAISIIKYLSRQWGVDVSFGESTTLVGGPDNICILTPGSMNFFAPNVKELKDSSQENLEAGLFGPFPLQGLPLFSKPLTGMEMTGFQLIL